MKNLSAIFILLVLLFCLSTLNTVAQDCSGKIKGLILDKTEARIAKGKIILRNKSEIKEFIANDAGEFEIVSSIGKYRITAEMDGMYSSKSKEIIVKKDETIELNFTLIGIRVDTEHP